LYVKQEIGWEVRLKGFPLQRPHWRVYLL